MLSPDARTVAMELLRPPPGGRLDLAVMTTYSLDLEALLALPLAVLAQAEDDVEELLADPLLLLEALREAGKRVQVFVDRAALAAPRKQRSLYGMLEDCVHPTAAPKGGAFHPKVWIARFDASDGATLIRVAVLSRNLTFDRCWDLALVSEAIPARCQEYVSTRELAALVRRLPGLSFPGPDADTRARIVHLADEVGRCRFPAPEGFDDFIAFRVLGIEPTRKRIFATGGRALAISPFANATGLDVIVGVSDGPRTLVGRQDELDRLKPEALASWDEVLVLAVAAEGEPDDASCHRPSGLHAKAVAIEDRSRVTWHVGSANLTSAALGDRRNVEIVASISGRRSGGKPRGIDAFLDSGFRGLCEPYRRSEVEPDVEEVTCARKALEETAKQLAAASLKAACHEEEGGWRWTIEGGFEIPLGVEVVAWPATIASEHAKPLILPASWKLPVAHLTAFVGFELTSPVKSVERVRMALKLPVEGLPEGRMAHVLRTLVDSPSRFLCFVRALLGGLEGMTDWAEGIDRGNGMHAVASGSWNGETLLDDLLRACSREPTRLEPLRRLIADLRATEEGRMIIPDDLHSMWEIVDSAARRNGVA